MKTGTEKILIILKVLALCGGIGYSIECGGQLLSFIASFINSDWAKRTYELNQNIFNIRESSIPFYAYAMCLNIITLALKATVWYVVYDLLLKLKLQTPFSVIVKKKTGTNYLPVTWRLAGKQCFLEDIYLLSPERHGHTITG